MISAEIIHTIQLSIKLEGAFTTMYSKVVIYMYRYIDAQLAMQSREDEKCILP